ncbi:hypothetical protein B0H13DRAFT_2653813, partial [Mycena leptocephala]
MPSFATFCDTPVFTRFDGRAASSCVSLDWVINSGIPTRGSQLSGPLTLPCNAGVISIFLRDVPVTASLPCDLVLGLDWVQLVRKSAQQVVVHLSSGALDLRTLGSSSIANPGVRFSALSVSTGGPGAVPCPSLMPSTRGIGVVAPGIPRTRETPTSCTRDGMSGQDVQTAGLPAAARTRGKMLNMNILNERDPFVRLSLEDKIAVVHFLIVDHRIDVLALRSMTARHKHVSSRLSGEKRKSADALRSEFLAHQCTEAC